MHEYISNFKILPPQHTAKNIYFVVNMSPYPTMFVIKKFYLKLVKIHIYFSHTTSKNEGISKSSFVMFCLVISYQL